MSPGIVMGSCLGPSVVNFRAIVATHIDLENVATRYGGCRVEGYGTSLRCSGGIDDRRAILRYLGRFRLRAQCTLDRLRGFVELARARQPGGVAHELLEGFVHAVFQVGAVPGVL